MFIPNVFPNSDVLLAGTPGGSLMSGEAPIAAGFMLCGFRVYLPHERSTWCSLINNVLSGTCTLDNNICCFVPIKQQSVCCIVKTKVERVRKVSTYDVLIQNITIIQLQYNLPRACSLLSRDATFHAFVLRNLPTLQEDNSFCLFVCLFEGVTLLCVFFQVTYFKIHISNFIFLSLKKSFL